MNTGMRSLHWWSRSLRIILLAFLVFALAFGGQATARAYSQVQAGNAYSLSSSAVSSQRVLSFPANALNYSKTSTILTQSDIGIRWEADFRDAAVLSLPRPADWDGTSDVTLRLFFYPIDNNAGVVDFFIRPRAYDPGSLYADASSMGADGAAVAGSYQVREQVYTIPAARFGSKALWYIAIQRGGEEETYTSAVILTSVSLTISMAPETSASLGYPANALNYDDASTILTQHFHGILWQADFHNGADISLPRPADWDGASPVTLRLFFYPLTGASGNVDFFIRPRAYNAGDLYGDAASISTAAVPVSAQRQIQQQVFTIPPDRFGNKAEWSVAIQRGGSGETYTDDVVLIALSLEYTQLKPQAMTLGFPGNALNYRAGGAIISQYTTGLLWQAGFQQAAQLSLPRPVDWNGTSPVTLRLFFYANTVPMPGDLAQFFIRPRAYDLGDMHYDAPSLSGPAVAITSRLQVQEQVFTIPAEVFGSKAEWVIALQRGGADETYTGDVVLTSYSLTYLTNRVFLPAVQVQSGD